MENRFVAVERESQDSRHAALHALLCRLRAQAYTFITPTPATHARYLAARGNEWAADMRDAFGWNLPFAGDCLPAPLLRALSEAAGVEWDGQAWKSAFRVASVDDRLYLHSAYPTIDDDAVFFGPDTYRFLRFIRQTLRTDDIRPQRVCDFGTGCGVGALEIARLVPGARIAAIDCNEKALALARLHAEFHQVPVECFHGDRLEACSFVPDLVIMNPPFMADPVGRTYRDGGGAHGAETTFSWISQAFDQLGDGGSIIAYTGTAIVQGRDALHEALASGYGSALRYEEIDVDIFGEEIGRASYAEVERIAAVGIVISK